MYLVVVDCAALIAGDIAREPAARAGEAALTVAHRAALQRGIAREGAVCAGEAASWADVNRPSRAAGWRE